MSKFIIALNEDVKTLDSKQYGTLEEAKSVATKFLEKLHNDIFTIPDGFEDCVSGYSDEDGTPVDILTILEVTSVALPQLGDIIFNSLDKWRIAENGKDDWLDYVKDKELDELNKLVTSWLSKHGYTPNWFNVKKSYLVSLEEDK